MVWILEKLSLLFSPALFAGEEYLHRRVGRKWSQGQMPLARSTVPPHELNFYFCQVISARTGISPF
jgi:hypothetical protein